MESADERRNRVRRCLYRSVCFQACSTDWSVRGYWPLIGNCLSSRAAVFSSQSSTNPAQRGARAKEGTPPHQRRTIRAIRPDTSRCWRDIAIADATRIVSVNAVDTNDRALVIYPNGMSSPIFSRQIAEELSFLFTDYAARFVESPSDDAPHAYSTVVVELPKLRLRFSTHRSDLRVEVAPMKLPHRWEELGTVLSWWDIRDGRKQTVYSYSRLQDVGDLLRPNLELLGTRLNTEA